MMDQNQIHVSIADFILALIIPVDVAFVLDGGFEGYVIVPSAECLVREERSAFAKASADERIDLRIYCYVGCSNAPKIWGKELYCARNGEHAL